MKCNGADLLHKRNIIKRYIKIFIIIIKILVILCNEKNTKIPRT
jgi:hypothetical protein